MRSARLTKHVIRGQEGNPRAVRARHKPCMIGGGKMGTGLETVRGWHPTRGHGPPRGRGDFTYRLENATSVSTTEPRQSLWSRWGRLPSTGPSECAGKACRDERSEGDRFGGNHWARKKRNFTKFCFSKMKNSPKYFFLFQLFLYLSFFLTVFFV